ncbi:MAG: DUF5661 family protein [Candidatus Peregrinibacteria bacterium]
MSTKKVFTSEQAQEIAGKIGLDFSTVEFDLEQFRMGMDVELEHGTVDPQTNVTDDDPVMTGKIALAHLREFSDYYTRLYEMEEEAEAYWEARKQ